MIERMTTERGSAELSESAQVWLRLKSVLGGQKVSYRRGPASAGDAAGSAEEQVAFGPGRDPVTTGSLLQQLFGRREWAGPLAEAQVIEQWARIAGEQVAQHARPLHVDQGVLVVQCDSTAWATQLRAIRSTILGTIAEQVPNATIEDLRILNPGAPSWKHGRRSVPGRGPRDTYG